jgi:hypothetical protein
MDWWVCNHPSFPSFSFRSAEFTRAETFEFHHNFSVQSYPIFATGSATSWKLLLVAGWTVRVPVPSKPSPSPSVWVLTGPPEVPTTWVSSYRRFSSQERLPPSIHFASGTDCTTTGPSWVAVRLAGRLRKRAQSVSEYDTQKKPCFLQGQILLVFYQNIWDNFFIFLFSSENSSS